uniref:Uncharacterized protein n=1 Tax=Arundo donax TaxID=35708 RepID=A0A0A9BQM4_ARUDO
MARRAGGGPRGEASRPAAVLMGRREGPGRGEADAVVARGDGPMRWSREKAGRRWSSR